MRREISNFWGFSQRIRFPVYGFFLDLITHVFLPLAVRAAKVLINLLA